MSDRRLTPFSGRVAHVSLKGQVAAEEFVEGEEHRVAAGIADLLASPGGARDRQLLLGEAFTVLDVRDGFAFGIAGRDGYCGWVATDALLAAPAAPSTHRISAARSYAKSTPGLKVMGAVTPLSFGAEVAVREVADGWARIAWGVAAQHVPAVHLTPLSEAETDPASVAERFTGTPYLWGGNSGFGIDCSGLVQAALLACGIPCPGDSDLQAAAFGPVDRGDLRRGDLVFWKGHVGIMADADRLIHANAHHMAVTVEPLADAAARIEAKGDGPITGCARPRP